MVECVGDGIDHPIDGLPSERGDGATVSPVPFSIDASQLLVE
jgi:hypothetical protein